jgi:mannose/cellobiose epimerase-like protein (N-acyl-D-glucosamine 2-epimerase family)
LSTIMHFAHWNWREDLWATYRRQLEFIQRFMIDDQYGGWFADSRGSGPLTMASPRQMSAWQNKSDIYHITNMYREALTICGQIKRPVSAVQ